MVTLRILDSDAPDSAPGPFAAVEARLLRELDTGEAGVANALDALFSAAVRHGVGDIHIEPWADATSVRWRVDGLLHEVARLPRQHHAKIAARTKILAKITVYQRDVPQDGRIDADATPCGQAMRVSLFPTVHGEKIVVRVLGAQGEIPALDALGFDAAIATRLREIVARPQGTLLLTGPSSSGKTTTIYALLQEIARVRGRAAHIVTIEDPVECKLPGVSQTQIAPGSGFTFDAAFRAILRQDPEVIMLGEIRDAETARLAVQAGLTGHLVISTIHSGTAAGVFTRLLDMGIEPFLVASSVTGVLAQRLVR
ncbi:MAG TPA: ATPase, T2SS/T4P/T4SS family, partial [Candidatus Hydrogenedentes bacterium]|nr:ATPase, T2SS/T4P/T4SS family [Candidatus Hydrogenedentota bacterium]